MVSASPDDGALLRIAVPNKGALSQAASEILRESGYRQRSDSKELALVDADNGVEFYYLRPRDIALYVGEGTLDVGITGRDRPDQEPLGAHRPGQAVERGELLHAATLDGLQSSGQPRTTLLA